MDYNLPQIGCCFLSFAESGISNPGGFVEGVTINNLLTAEPHGRNPALADVMKRI